MVTSPFTRLVGGSFDYLSPASVWGSAVAACDSRMVVGGLPAFLHTFPSFLSSDYLFKLLLIGDSGVGKSCLLLRFAVSKKLPILSIWGSGW